METKRLIVALDVPSEVEALRLAEELKDEVAFMKVGLELLSSVGPSIVQKLHDLGCRVFYDGKFKDIPNTVAGASRAVARLGVGMFNVHAMGGVAMMQAAVKAAEQGTAEIGGTRPLVLAVTILTSIDQSTLNEEMRVPGDLMEQVIHLARLAQSSGLDGVVASPKEVSAIRKALPESFVIATPGVRPVWAAANEQRRITTPSDAIRAGASYLVVGRPITNCPREIGRPSNAARKINDEVAEALGV